MPHSTNETHPLPRTNDGCPCKEQPWKVEIRGPTEEAVIVLDVRLWANNFTVARATLDSGSRLNWMSEDVAKRIGAQINNLDPGENTSFGLMGTYTLEPLGKVVATWCAIKGQVSRASTFFIAPNGSVDMLLGAELLRRENILIFNESVLPITDTDQTHEVHLQKGKNVADQKKRSDEAKIRREKTTKEEELSQGAGNPK